MRQEQLYQPPGASTMTPADREFALKGLDDRRKRLLATLRRLSREQLEYRQAPDRWSVAENLEPRPRSAKSMATNCSC
jgi:hypothetical protein